MTFIKKLKRIKLLYIVIALLSTKLREGKEKVTRGLGNYFWKVEKTLVGYVSVEKISTYLLTHRFLYLMSYSFIK